MAFAACTVFQSKLQTRTSSCKSDKSSRGVLCEVLPVNCENEEVNFRPGQRKALEGLILGNCVVYVRA